MSNRSRQILLTYKRINTVEVKCWNIMLEWVESQLNNEHSLLWYTVTDDTYRQKIVRLWSNHIMYAEGYSQELTVENVKK